MDRTLAGTHGLDNVLLNLFGPHVCLVCEFQVERRYSAIDCVLSIIVLLQWPGPHLCLVCEFRIDIRYSTIDYLVRMCVSSVSFESRVDALQPIVYYRLLSSILDHTVFPSISVGLRFY
jgi:hypothetical protein